MPTLPPEVKELAARVRNWGRRGGRYTFMLDASPQPFTRGVGSSVNSIVIE